MPLLDRLGLLSALDADALIDCAIVSARLTECERALSLGGLVRDVYREDRDGALVLVGSQRHPLSVTAKEYRAQLKHYMNQFGLGPASRGQMKPPATGGEDDDLLD